MPYLLTYTCRCAACRATWLRSSLPAQSLVYPHHAHGGTALILGDLTAACRAYMRNLVCTQVRGLLGLAQVFLAPGTLKKSGGGKPKAD